MLFEAEKLKFTDLLCFGGEDGLDDWALNGLFGVKIIKITLVLSHKPFL